MDLPNSFHETLFVIVLINNRRAKLCNVDFRRGCHRAIICVRPHAGVSLLPARQTDSSDDLAGAKGSAFSNPSMPAADGGGREAHLHRSRSDRRHAERTFSGGDDSGMTLEELPTVTEAAPRAWAAWV